MPKHRLVRLDASLRSKINLSSDSPRYYLLSAPPCEGAVLVAGSRGWEERAAHMSRRAGLSGACCALDYANPTVLTAASRHEASS